MKTVLLVVYCTIIILTFSHTKAEPEEDKYKDIASAGIDTLNFKTDIQPILQKNCSPCHFEGGKMYATMPFDKGETIVSHEAGALKRFSDKKENLLLKKFIEQRKIH
jgi:hypothetical protein